MLLAPEKKESGSQEEDKNDGKPDLQRGRSGSIFSANGENQNKAKNMLADLLNKKKESEVNFT